MVSAKNLPNASSVDTTSPNLEDLQAWHKPMLRFARLHLKNLEDAQDAVQDTFETILLKKKTDANTTYSKAYLFGILHHKLLDRLRQTNRYESSYDDKEMDDLDQILFDQNGHWCKGVQPKKWHTPDEHLETEAFFAMIDWCMDTLPEKMARVFSMKELLECKSTEICLILKISKTDYWKSMSRARQQLQLCLNQHWFEKGVSR